MKFFKGFLITLSALLITGCYTQLQYSQTMKKITDREKVDGYSWSGDEQANETEQIESGEAQTAKEYSEYTTEAEEQIPIYYKDYDYVEGWNECGCNPYKVYNFYGYTPYNHWYSYRPYGAYLSLSPFYYHKWHFRTSYGFAHRFYGSRFGFSFGWGSPFYYDSYWYDPFWYDPFWYDPYWYGYHPFAFNHYYYRGYGFYRGYRHGMYYGGYYGYEKDRDARRNTRYGPRSVGTNRVGTNITRSRDGNGSGRSATVTNSTVRSRSSVGTIRTRGNVTRSTTGSSVTRSRSRSGNEGGTTRTRSRNNIQRDDNNQRQSAVDNRNRVRSRNDVMRSNIIRSRSAGIDRNTVQRLEDRSSIQNRLRSRTVRTITIPRRDYNYNSRSRTTFFNRVKDFFDSSKIINTRSSNRSIRINSPSSSTRSRSTVRPSNSSSRSSVSRSSSSSSSSRSRGSSSRSRSGGSSGGSDRSRGNN